LERARSARKISGGWKYHLTGMDVRIHAPAAATPGAAAADVERASVAVDELLWELVTQIRDTLRVDTAAVLLLDESRENLIPRAAKGLEEEVEAQVRIPVGKGFAGRVAARRHPTIIDDLDSADIVNPILRQKGLNALLGVPIEVDEKVLGVLHVGSLTPRKFTEDDIRLLQLVAGRIALPIIQSQLYEVEREARRALEAIRSQLAFLSDTSAVLGSSLDYETTLATLARLVVPQLADWCVIDIVGADDRVQRVAAVCADELKTGLARELQESYPARPNRGEGTSKVVRTGRSELAVEVTDEWIEQMAPNDRQREILRSLGLCSNILVPLVARGRTLGVLTIATAESRRTYDDSDLRLAEELAARAALAVDNARLFRDAEETLGLLDALFATAPVGLAFFDRELRFLKVNETLASFNGIPREQHIGRALGDVIPALAPVVAELVRTVLQTGKPILEREVSGVVGPGDERVWLASYYPVRTAHGQTVGVGAVVADITGRKRAERRLAAQYEVTRALSDAPSLDAAAPDILRAFCENLDWPVGALWLVDEEGDRLRLLTEWHRPEAAADAPAASELRRDDGFAGAVWEHARPRWAEEHESAAAGGTAFGFPILRGPTIVGVAEFHSRVERVPDDELLEMSASVGSQIGQFIERRRAEHESEEARERLSFLAEASRLLASSLDYEATLQRVAQLAVPSFADWCIVDVVEGERIRRLAVAAARDESQQALEELRRHYPPTLDSPQPAARALRESRPVLFYDFTPDSLASTTRDEYHYSLMQRLEPRSALAVPLVARGHTVGAITFARAESGRRFSNADLPLAEEIARRAALAVDNARLHRQTEERARAALVLSHVGDGVFMLDRDGLIRLWNPAAEAITGLSADEVVGAPAEQVVPGWVELEPRIPVAASPAPAARRAETLPLDIHGRELWLSVTGVGLEEGTVYAFRDLTEERALEKMRSDFVATISHELRTPLASVYGAALTLLERENELGRDQRSRLLSVIASEAERLARIVNDVLLASRLDSQTLTFSIQSCNPLEALEKAVEAARTHLPDETQLRLVNGGEAAPVAADPERLRQVLTNLIDNAVKYSPGGGVVEAAVERRERRVQFRVSDHGIGIPSDERDRIFEKFYRLDPELLQGVGGTGLGLYITRELVRRMQGSIWVDSELGRGSTFYVELPIAETVRAAGLSSAASR